MFEFYKRFGINIVNRNHWIDRTGKSRISSMIFPFESDFIQAINYTKRSLMDINDTSNKFQVNNKCD